MGYAVFDAAIFFWVGLFEQDEAFAETGCVLMGDGENTDAALGAARLADEVLAAAVVGVGYGGVNDLDKGLGHRDSVGRIALRRSCD